MADPRIYLNKLNDAVAKWRGKYEATDSGFCMAARMNPVWLSTVRGGVKSDGTVYVRAGSLNKLKDPLAEVGIDVADIVVPEPDATEGLVRIDVNEFVKAVQIWRNASGTSEAEFCRRIEVGHSWLDNLRRRAGEDGVVAISRATLDACAGPFGAAGVDISGILADGGEYTVPDTTPANDVGGDSPDESAHPNPATPDDDDPVASPVPPDIARPTPAGEQPPPLPFESADELADLIGEVFDQRFAETFMRFHRLIDNMAEMLTHGADELEHAKATTVGAVREPPTTTITITTN